MNFKEGAEDEERNRDRRRGKTGDEGWFCFGSAVLPGCCIRAAVSSAFCGRDGVPSGGLPPDRIHSGNRALVFQTAEECRIVLGLFLS